MRHSCVMTASLSRSSTRRGVTPWTRLVEYITSTENRLYSSFRVGNNLTSRVLSPGRLFGKVFYRHHCLMPTSIFHLVGAMLSFKVMGPLDHSRSAWSCLYLHRYLSQPMTERIGLNGLSGPLAAIPSVDVSYGLPSNLSPSRWSYSSLRA